MPLCTASRCALFTTVFLSCVSFAIVMPSLWPYLHTLHSTKSFLAYVVAVYSVGEALGALYFARLSAVLSTRATLVAATLVGALGSLLYVAAEALPRGPALVLVARLLQGVWTGGAQAVQQCYLADVLRVDQLTATTVTLNAYACLGFVIGPGFGLAFAVLPHFPIAAGFTFSQLTAPGYFVLASAAFTIVLLAVVFDEERDRGGASAQRDLAVYEAIELGTRENTPLLKADSKHVEEHEPLSSQLGVALLICNVAFFTHFYGFALQETITTPVVQAFYNWSVFSANLLFTGAGFCALATFLFVGIATQHISDRLLTLISLGLGAVGYMLLLSTPDAPLPINRFLAGFAMISVAFPMGRAVVISLYTKLLPMRLQGSGQGVILAVGAVARIIGPFWAVRAFYMTWGSAIVFGVTAGLFAICMGLVGGFYHSLKT